MPSVPRPVAWFIAHRRRLAPVVLVTGVVVVGLVARRAIPHDTRVRYAFGPDHAGVRAVELGYLHDADVLQGVTFRWSGGAPRSFDHEISLPAGRYEVRARITDDAGERVLLRSLEVPAEGLVHIDLFDQAYARLRLPAPVEAWP